MGGNLHHGHFEMIRNGINRKLDEKRMFAIWRIDAPWKPWTKKGSGHRMGKGKGKLELAALHYSMLCNLYFLMFFAFQVASTNM